MVALRRYSFCYFTSSGMPRSMSSHPASEMGSRGEARSSKPLFLVKINPRPTIPRELEQVCQATSVQAEPAMGLAAPRERFLPSLSPPSRTWRGSEKKSLWKNCGFKRQPTGSTFSPALSSSVPWANDSSHLNLYFPDYKIGQQAEPGQAVMG